MTNIEQKDSPEAEPPTLLERELADGGAAHQDADQLLLEAIKALRTKLTVISHNLANADTIGFKRSRVLLEDCNYRQLRLPGAQDAFNNYAPVGISVGQGCRVQSVEFDFSQGAIDITNRSLDVAITGDAFFRSSIQRQMIFSTRVAEALP